jgi:AcrR family transcriptional regulator
MAPEARRAQIVEAAARLILQQRHLPLPLESLAREAGVSKALIYAYFPTQHDLFNAVLDREFAALVAGGVEAASQAPSLEAAALGCGLAYFERVAEAGPVIHIVLRDLFMAQRLCAPLAAFRNRIVRRIARLSRRELQLPAKENIAAISMSLTIPEEAGRLAQAGEMDKERARELCRELILSSLEAFRPRVG